MTVQALNAAAAQEARPSGGSEVRKMEGLMWYNMLSEMNKNGLDADTLGAGSDAYQSLFSWDIAEHDFGKYDTGLTSATLRQIGGRASSPPALAGAGPSPADATAVAGGPAAAIPAGAASGPDDAAGSEASGAASSAVLVAHAAELARSIWPAIRVAASVLGVPPVGLLAQAALETGWGSAVPGNNMFGIKAAAGQASTVQATHEMINGSLVPRTASFRDYSTPAACVTDYIRLIQSNFQNVVGHGSVTSFANALQAGGFATDSNYASKIIMISQSPMMEQMLQAVGAETAPAD
ncbi:glycoside hydrolase family 73 protein [Acidisoma sp.]|uniref:glycoside hydrolase family 73 protein n=1 Tax=Acidisoma sp. TaxID=1872115 RepID=UPI003B00FBD7